MLLWYFIFGGYRVLSYCFILFSFVIFNHILTYQLLFVDFLLIYQCPHLNLVGFMTIGKYGGDATEDFMKLVECRDIVANALGKESSDMELSMGMSSDFELAVELGSTNVRVGSTIFGSR